MTDKTHEAQTVAWELYETQGFEPLMRALDRAASKGYLPDAVAEEWEAFNFRAPGAAHAPTDGVRRGMERVRDALELGRDAVAAELAEKEAAYGHHLPHKLAAIRADLTVIDDAIAALPDQSDAREQAIGDAP